MMKVYSRLLLLALTASILLCSCEAGPLCQQCIGEECDLEPAECMYGVVRDYCGRKVCAKGPGQRCGGQRNMIGQCGEGMHCRCERCVGCFVETLECFPYDDRTRHCNDVVLSWHERLAHRRTH